MPDPRPLSVLRLEPHMIPELKRAFREAADELRPALERLRLDGRIPEPWMGDPVSAQVQDRYNRIAMDATSPHSAYGRLKQYEAELLNVYNALVAMEQNYRTTEDATVDLVRRAG